MTSSRIHVPIDPDPRGVRSVRFQALGAPCAIQFRCPDQKTALRFVADALGWLQSFEAKFSRFRPDSMLSAINRAAGRQWVKVDREMEHMLDLGDAVHRLTGGLLDPAMLPLLQVWNWKKAHERLPAEAEIAAALALCDWRCVERKPGMVYLAREGMGLDFGGFGKEHAVDQVIGIARKYGVQDVLVDLGRDLFALGGNGVHPFWHVGIQDGLNPERCIGGLGVANHAVCASGDYIRNFEHEGVRYGHIIDRRNGWPVRHGMRAVTVLASSCVVAGIYSTAAFILGMKEGLQFVEYAPGVEACLQDERGILQSRFFANHQVQPA